eukprot:CCRYP_015778-RA/>CCRYP_015778-RA protein AED:0.34 eAED:0.37 QI:0/0/0/1/0/0/2/0/144
MLLIVVAGAFGASFAEPHKVQLFLVDRSGSLAKDDTKIQKAIKDTTAIVVTVDCLKLDALSVTRIKCDLANFHMPTALPFLCPNPSLEIRAYTPSKMIVIAKHLRGSGTDLALKLLCEIAPTGSIYGCVMTTCCHGICEWKDYT